MLTNIYGAVYRGDRRAEVFEGWADLRIDVEIITTTSAPDAALNLTGGKRRQPLRKNLYFIGTTPHRKFVAQLDLGASPA